MMFITVVILLQITANCNADVGAGWKITHELVTLALKKKLGFETTVMGATEKHVTFLYWNSNCGNNNPAELKLNQEEELFKYWIEGLPLKVIVHGWLDSTEYEDDGVTCVKKAYVDVGGFNVITADWGELANSQTYPMAAIFTKDVGAIIARLLHNIMQLEIIQPKDIHIIGHSLGAHIAGVIGSHFTGSDQIGRITALDPACPGFEIFKINTQRLRSTDALFVDVIHSSAGTGGYSKSIGHADFRPNGGKAPQPGCFSGFQPMDIFKAICCSHSRAYLLYADSVYHRNSMQAVECGSWDEFNNGGCTSGYQSYMGHDANPNARGDFYLETNRSAPYAHAGAGTSYYYQEEM
ncbi:lipase member H-A-like isoform X2 [Adelges cooleyi]|uniref:lipase member H-A-like isoform X2 n=1 Tax=Adelges cooleyi TaxID=133065 RepID=UPI00217FFE36|nr:lipase member H-A-like isoform X2 [Adelges cooleyi]